MDLIVEGPVITVRDHGPGFPDYLRDHGPQRFRTRGTTPGHGLGLPNSPSREAPFLSRLLKFLR